MSNYIPNHDSHLDDALYRRDLIDEERRTWEDEMADDDDNCNADDGGSY